MLTVSSALSRSMTTGLGAHLLVFASLMSLIAPAAWNENEMDSLTRKDYE